MKRSRWKCGNCNQWVYSVASVSEWCWYLTEAIVRSQVYLKRSFCLVCGSSLDWSTRLSTDWIPVGK